MRGRHLYRPTTTSPPHPTACLTSERLVVLMQALCFMAGANSIFDGDKLLTTPNNDRNEDMQVGA